MEIFKPFIACYSRFSARRRGLRLRPLEKDQPGIGDGNYRLFGNSFLGFYLSRKPASLCGRYRSSGQRCGQDPNPNLAASIVLLSTFFSIMTIPLVLWLIL